MSTLKDQIASILAEELAPARASAVADRIVAAVPTGPGSEVVQQVIGLLTGQRASASPKGRQTEGRAAKAAQVRAAKPAKPSKPTKTAKQPRAAKPAKTAKTGGRLNLTPEARKLVQERAQLRWARTRIAKGQPDPGDEALVARLEKKLGALKKKTAPKATRRPAASRTPAPRAQAAAPAAASVNGIAHAAPSQVVAPTLPA